MNGKNRASLFTCLCLHEISGKGRWRLKVTDQLNSFCLNPIFLSKNSLNINTYLIVNTVQEPVNFKFWICLYFREHEKGTAFAWYLEAMIQYWSIICCNYGSPCHKALCNLSCLCSWSSSLCRRCICISVVCSRLHCLSTDPLQAYTPARSADCEQSWLRIHTSTSFHGISKSHSR